MVTTEEPQSSIEPGEFAWMKKEGGGFFKHNPYAKISGCNRVLVDALTDFKVTPWGLARLLGLPWLADVYKWTRGVQRPSHMYMTRLVKLYQLHNQGLRLFSVHNIDWDGDGRIYYKKAVDVSGTSGVSSKRRSLSKPSSQNRDSLAEFLNESPR